MLLCRYIFGGKLCNTFQRRSDADGEDERMHNQCKCEDVESSLLSLHKLLGSKVYGVYCVESICILFYTEYMSQIWRS